MIFFRKAELGSSLGERLFSWGRRIEETINHLRVRRMTERNRRELLKLGNHLLQDVGLDPQGHPLAPNWFEVIDSPYSNRVLCTRMRSER